MNNKNVQHVIKILRNGKIRVHSNWIVRVVNPNYYREKPDDVILCMLCITFGTSPFSKGSPSMYFRPMSLTIIYIKIFYMKWASFVRFTSASLPYAQYPNPWSQARQHCSLSKYHPLPCQVFGKASRRDVVSFIGMISGYEKHGSIANACEVFDIISQREMFSYSENCLGAMRSPLPGWLQDMQNMVA